MVDFRHLISYFSLKGGKIFKEKSFCIFYQKPIHYVVIVVYAFLLTRCYSLHLINVYNKYLTTTPEPSQEL